jgi:hypothetical protein
MNQGESRLRGDFLQQLLYVGRNTHRLIAMQDQDPCSPSFGCFHYPYWRDKTSEFPDARYQEAGAALGLLSLAVFDGFRDAEGWPSREILIGSFRSGLRNLARQQYPEGCYDEWYKGERGFAATAFTTAAYGIAGALLGDSLSAEDRDVLTHTLDKAANWLSQCEDLVKTNHQIVAATALAAVWKLTGKQWSRHAAAHKLEAALANRTEEGWFLELGGADLGYGHLIFDQLMLYERMMKDGKAERAASRLLEFLIPHLHPDVTISPDGSTCRNQYVGQVGFLLLREDSSARAVVAKLSSMKDSSKRIHCYLGDDLRLARWALYPVLAAHFVLASHVSPLGDALDCYPQGWTIHPAAGLAAYHRGDLHVYVPAAGGAVTRIYRGDRLIIEDLGLDIREGDVAFTARTYESGRPIAELESGISLSVSFGQAHYLFPSFLQRLVLRVGSVTPWSSRLIRTLIDRYRVKHKTAGNQSAALVQSGARRFTLLRQVEIDGDTLRITDLIRDDKNAMSADTIFSEIRPSTLRRLTPLRGFTSAATLQMTKSIATKHTEPEICFELICERPRRAAAEC